MKLKQILTLTTAILLFAALAGESMAQTILFSDDFERTTGSGDGNGNPAGTGNGASDWGTNNNALGGTNAAPYLTTASRSGGANQVTGVNPFDATLGSHGHLLNGGAVLGFSAAAASPLGFDVAFDFDRNTDSAVSPASGGFLAVGLGIGSASSIQGLSALSDTEIGILFQQAANGNAANANVIVAGDTANPVTSFDYLDPSAVHSVVLSIRPQAAGQYGAGSTIDYSLTVDGTPAVSTMSFVAAGGDVGLVSFSSNNFDQRYIDNLVITSVPEPGSIFLLLTGLGTLLVRKR